MSRTPMLHQSSAEEGGRAYLAVPNRTGGNGRHHAGHEPVRIPPASRVAPPPPANPPGRYLPPRPRPPCLFSSSPGGGAFGLAPRPPPAPRGLFSPAPGGGALGLAPRPPRAGGCQPSFDGPFWKNFASLLNRWSLAYIAFAWPKILPARNVSS